MPGVFKNPPGDYSPGGSDANIDVANKNGVQVVFNEQTNYVPKRTIITVSLPRIGLSGGYV
jgi:hypothetical protein